MAWGTRPREGEASSNGFRQGAASRVGHPGPSEWDVGVPGNGVPSSGSVSEEERKA